MSELPKTKDMRPDFPCELKEKGDEENLNDARALLSCPGAVGDALRRWEEQEPSARSHLPQISIEQCAGEMVIKGAKEWYNSLFGDEKPHDKPIHDKRESAIQKYSFAEEDAGLDAIYDQ